MFMPFVLVQCGNADLPYDQLADEDAQQEVDLSISCQSETYLTEECYQESLNNSSAVVKPINSPDDGEDNSHYDDNDEDDTSSEMNS